MSSLGPVSVIEAAYRVELGQSAWLEEISRTMHAANPSALGALAVLYDASRPDWVAPLGFGSHNLPPDLPAGLFKSYPLSAEDQATIIHAYRSPVVAPLRHSLLPRCMIDDYGVLLGQFGMDDLLCVNAVDPTHRGCLVLVPSRPVKSPPSKAQVWRRLAAHVAAGARLRRSLDELAKTEVAATEHAEAVLTPSGRVDHATGPATERRARERLQESIVRVERARSRQPTADEAVALWEALVAGRWSVVEHFERDGKRYYLAHRNEAELAPDRELTAREQQVLAYAELGCSNKLIAYSLGLATSTVSTLLTSARAKLGVRPKPR